MYMKFTKMHGLGNDFIVIDEREKQLKTDFIDLAKKLCDRHLGIGADGLIRVLPSKTGDYKMEIINSDGSIPEMCGNGIRCFAKFIYDNEKKPKTEYKVETGAGILVPVLDVKNKNVAGITVDMGEPILEPAKIPMVGYKENLNQSIRVFGEEYIFTAVSMGNPHIVIFGVDLKNLELNEVGPDLENHKAFPARTNVHFVNIISRNEIRVRHWERGAGETMACGTGACACVVAGVLGNKLERVVTVHVPGGDLKIRWDEKTNHVFMQGPAETVYEGELND
jgi:diaminopimelate epimerase